MAERIAPPGAISPLQVRRNRESSIESVSLELSLAPPGRRKSYVVNPSPPEEMALTSQTASSSGNERAGVKLRLWPNCSPRKEEKNTMETSENVDTANSSTLLPAREEEEIQSVNRRRPEEKWPEKWKEMVSIMTKGTATPPERVLEKKLYASDVTAGPSRLLLAENMEPAGGSKRKGPKLLLNNLTDEEKAAAAAAGRDGGGGLPILLLDRRGREYPAAKLKFWQSSDSYVLLGKWTDLVRENELDPGDVIDVYFFRHSSGLGLAVCSRISTQEEERRRRDDPKARRRRRKEKGDKMRIQKRRSRTRNKQSIFSSLSN